MIKINVLLIILFQTACLYSTGQMDSKVLNTDLEPNNIYGRRHPFKRNLSFAAYSTSKLKRTVGSFLMPGTINPLNSILRIEGIPLLHKEKYRNKDVFSFRISKQDNTFLEVECRALLKVREKFTLLRKQDASFFGKKNTDFLIASIVSQHDKANKWSVIASNLNATNEEAQKGKIISENEEVCFELCNLLLKDANIPNQQEKNFTTANRVYAFTYNGKIVAAVSVNVNNRKFWIQKDLNINLQDAIAATAAILTIRRNLYR
ncbi:hypothetical protein [Lacibacter sp.]|uniref:hypothetical protein n=1 Tax=Lacibacter sp. TaxID=1915409 RepID=UPI002B4AE551|nr:hypothetical protein [Lacibacter sp.]HLP37038.1 hypothetical protein [Lacibacter sp.]